MKHFCLVFGMMLLLLAIDIPVAAQRTDTSRAKTYRDDVSLSQNVVSGFVFDKASSKPLRGAFAELTSQNERYASVYSADNGSFSLAAQGISSFKIAISLPGYEPFTSQEYKVVRSQKGYNIGRIFLNRIPVRDTVSRPPNTQPSVREPVPVTTEEVLNDHFRVNDILPTNGAYELFYALNPELRNRREIPRNYHIITPRFPPFRETKNLFNDRFKMDKNKQEPYISQNQNKEGEEIELTKNEYQKSKFFASANAAQSFSNPSFADNIYPGTLNKFDRKKLFRGPKKFVFVIWKYDAYGKTITEGPEVEGKYKVIYFTDRNRNEASNATYGYAPMNDAKYNIEVYEQATGRRLRISDDVVDPRVYYEKNDIFFMFNVKWIQILITVYD